MKTHLKLGEDSLSGGDPANEGERKSARGSIERVSIWRERQERLYSLEVSRGVLNIEADDFSVYGDESKSLSSGSTEKSSGVDYRVQAKKSAWVRR